jgi:hypothetical protein
MVSASTETAAHPSRRHALRLATVNGVLWSLGTGLIVGTLIIYLAQASGLGRFRFRCLLLAAACAGLVRLFTPWYVRIFDGYKSTATRMFLISYALQIAAVFYVDAARPGLKLTALISSWCVAQLLEDIGMVALWSWLGDLAPSPIRGRYFGRRESWKLIGFAFATAVAGLFVNDWQARYSADTPMVKWGFMMPIVLGGVFRFASAVLLFWIPEISDHRSRAKSPFRWNVLSPLGNPRYSRLLLFGCWIGFFAGLIDLSTEAFFVEKLSDIWLILLVCSGTALGQGLLSPILGRLCDRIGNRAVIAVSEVVTASAMIFLIVSEERGVNWIYGAFLAMTAYAGVRVGLYNLMLKLAPRGESATYVANFFSFSALAFAVGGVAGRVLLLALSYQDFRIAGQQLSDYGYIFYIGWATLTIAVILVFGLDEPGARPWSELLNLGNASAPKQIEPQKHPLD